MTTALAQPRNPRTFPLSVEALPLAAGAPKCWSGAQLYLDPSVGAVRPGISGNSGLFPAGIAQETVDNSGGSSTTPVLVKLPAELNCVWLDNSTAAPVTTRFTLCYVDSDHSVTANPVGTGGQPNSIAGRVWGIDTIKGVLVQPLMSLIESYLGEEASPDGNSAFSVRGVATSIGANTGTGTGKLTVTATGALGAQDGLTYTAGQQIFIQPGTSNVAAVDSGPWVVTNPGGVGVQAVLTRPAWWSHGAAWISGSEIIVGGEGTNLANTTWRATAASALIDATDPAFYCGRFVFQATLVAGTLVMAAGTPKVGILSTSKSALLVDLQTNGGTQTTTASYGGKITAAGYVGASALSLFAYAVGMATQTGDTSVLNCVLDNGF